MTDIKKYNKLIVVIIVSCIVNFGLTGIITNSSCASYIQCILSCLVALFVYYIIYNKHINNFFMSKATYVKLISVVTVFVLIIYSAGFIGNTCELINKFFMKKSPSYYLCAFLALPCCFGAFYGLRTMSRYSVIIWLMLVLSVCFMLFFCFNEYSVNNLFPVFGTDKNTLILNSFDFSIYGGILIFYYCLIGKNINPSSAKKNILKIILFSGLISTLICFMLNLILPYQAVVHVDNPLLTLASFININFLLERSEIIVLIILLSLCFITVGTFFASVCLIAEKSIGISDRKGIAGCLFFNCYLLSVVFSKYNISVYALEFSKYGVFVISVLIPFVAYIRGE